MINCYAFGMVPPFAQGLVRDLRVRWALEEAGVPYRITLIGVGVEKALAGQMAAFDHASAERVSAGGTR